MSGLVICHIFFIKYKKGRLQSFKNKFLTFPMNFTILLTKILKSFVI